MVNKNWKTQKVWTIVDRKSKETIVFQFPIEKWGVCYTFITKGDAEEFLGKCDTKEEWELYEFNPNPHV